MIFRDTANRSSIYVFKSPVMKGLGGFIVGSKCTKATTFDKNKAIIISQLLYFLLAQNSFKLLESSNSDVAREI